jgi:hypothetical protein
MSCVCPDLNTRKSPYSHVRMLGNSFKRDYFEISNIWKLFIAFGDLNVLLKMFVSLKKHFQPSRIFENLFSVSSMQQVVDRIICVKSKLTE